MVQHFFVQRNTISVQVYKPQRGERHEFRKRNQPLSAISLSYSAPTRDCAIQCVLSDITNVSDISKSSDGSVGDTLAISGVLRTSSFEETVRDLKPLVDLHLNPALTISSHRSSEASVDVLTECGECEDIPKNLSVPLNINDIQSDESVNFSNGAITYASVLHTLIPKNFAAKDSSINIMNSSELIQCAYDSCNVNHSSWNFVNVGDGNILYYGADGTHDLTNVSFRLEPYECLKSKSVSIIPELGNNSRPDLKRTRMCRSIAERRDCSYRNYFFAHSADELVVRDIPSETTTPIKYRICPLFSTTLSVTMEQTVISHTLQKNCI
jgi:hypothetical protein